MLPVSEINLDDIFVNRLHGSGYVGYLVDNINHEEKMIRLQPVDLKKLMPFGSPFWKKNTDSLFAEGNRF